MFRRFIGAWREIGFSYALGVLFEWFVLGVGAVCAFVLLLGLLPVCLYILGRAWGLLLG